MVNQKHISSWTPCLSKRNDRITTTLAAENFPNETWIQAIFQPKSTRNIEGVLCNLSLVSGGCFYNKSEVKSGKTWSENRVNVTIVLHSSVRCWSSVEFQDEYWEEKPFKCGKDENVEGRKDQEKKKRQTKSTKSFIVNVKLPKSRKIEIAKKKCHMLHWCTCVSYYKS